MYYSVLVVESVPEVIRVNLTLLVNNSLITQDYDCIIKEWLLDAEISDNSKSTYEFALKRYIKYLEDNNKGSSRNTIIEFKNEMISCYSNSTAYILLSGIKSFYRYLSRKYNIQDIAKDVKLPKIPRGFKKDCLSVEQVSQLLSSLKEDTLTHLRDKAMINLFIRCGLRCCEVINANIEDISTKDGQKVLYIKGKGHTEKDDFVVLTADMLRILDKYLIARKDYIDKSPLFASVSNRSYGKRLDSSTIRAICKRYLKAIGINSPRVSVHSLRHTAVTLSILAGAGIIDVRDFARHTDINTSLRYIHNLKRLENAPELKIDEFLKENISNKKDEIIS